MRKFILPLLALGCLSFAVLHVVRAQQEGPEVLPPVDPARSPYGSAVVGSGLVEARTENIAVGSPLPGVVTKVHVQVGQQVKPTDPLFELDDRALKAEEAHRQASLKIAEVQLQRLKEQPRKEERDISAAKLRETEVYLADQKDQWTRARGLISQRAISDDEWERRQHAYRSAQEQLARVQVEHAMIVAGAWKWDKDVAETQVEQAKAQLGQTQTELKRLVVRALVAGQVMQVSVKPGEYVGTPPSQALIWLGDVNTRHVRVDIDENDIPRFKKDRPARARLRGDPTKEYALTFVRVEPYVVPKKSLTGESRERVDTRVLQVIYALTKADDVYVGQQVDVFVESE